MMQIGAAVEPLIGPRQRRCACTRVETSHLRRIRRRKLPRYRTQLRLNFIPPVERGLQSRGDIRDRYIALERAVDNDQLAVAVSPPQACKLHLSVRQLST